MVEVRAQGTLQGWVNLGEQPADPVGRGGDLGREVVVEAAEDPEFSQRFIVHSDRAQCVGHGACGLGDGRRVPGVGFGLARVQVRDPAAWQGQAGSLPLRRQPGRPQRAVLR